MKKLERMDGKLFESLQPKAVSNLAAVVGGRTISLRTTHVFYVLDAFGTLQRTVLNDKQDWSNGDDDLGPFEKVGDEYCDGSVLTGNDPVPIEDEYPVGPDGVPM